MEEMNARVMENEVILTICTGGLWLIWILIRYLRNNS